MTFTEKFNLLFPNKEAFMKAVEASGPPDDYDECISPRGSIPAACFRNAMAFREEHAGASVCEPRASYGRVRVKSKPSAGA